MRANERASRETLERTLKSTKELSDRFHYQEVSESARHRAENALEQLKEIFTRDRLDVHGQCFLASHELRQECERLQEELDRRAGRPPRPDPLKLTSPLLSQLPPNQASAIRSLMALAKPSAPAPETVEAFDRARALVQRLEAAAADVRREAALIYEVTAEKARRGWADVSEVERRRPELEKFLAEVDAGVAKSREFLVSSLAEYESLKQRRQELRMALASQISR